MNCREFRRAFGADPQRVDQHADRELQEHRAQCAACENYARETLRLDGLIRSALEVPVAPTANPVANLVAFVPPQRPQVRWYAMAASVLLAVAVGAFWFFGFPRDSLASAVVAHVQRERDVARVTDVRVSAELLDGVLRAKGMHLTKPMSDVSFSENCEIRGHLVPHLVVQTKDGPVTVIILAEETVETARRFDEQRYHGVLVPMRRGGAAIIANDASLVDTVAERIKESIATD
jgi:hypothetical protein